MNRKRTELTKERILQLRGYGLLTKEIAVGKNIVDSSSGRWDDSSRPFEDGARSCAEAFDASPSSYYIADWGGRVAVLKCYGDESFGKPQSGSQGCYAVAGYLGDSDVWKQLTVEWQRVLTVDPSIEYFHMSECLSAIEGKQDKYPPGQFADVSSIEARKKLDAVVTVMEKFGHSLAWVQSITTWDIWEHAFPQYDKEMYGSPYYFCVAGVINCCREVLTQLRLPHLPVDFVFDDQQGSDYVKRAWDMVKQFSHFPDCRDVSAVMGSITFADDKACVPLQCADLLAWHVRRNYIQPSEDHGRARPEYERLRNSINRICESRTNEETTREERADIWRRMLEAYEARKAKSV